MLFFANLLKAIFGWLLNLGKANITEIADSNARAQEQLAHERSANEAESTAALARADAADRVVHVIANSEGGADAADELKREFPDEFRD